ncbi:MAG: hypothetical protein Q8L74_09160 [Nitrospirota bacterium]|nr:hypothetical protein [Nitrospirota bacterium]
MQHVWASGFTFQVQRVNDGAAARALRASVPVILARMTRQVVRSARVPTSQAITGHLDQVAFPVVGYGTSGRGPAPD